MRPPLSAVILGAALFVARPALSGPSLTDHLVAGAALPKDTLLVAGDDGATYELRGGAVVVLAPGTTFSFEPSIRLKLRKPGDPETVARSVRVTAGRAEVKIPAAYREQTAVLLRGPGKLSAVAKEGSASFVTDGDRTTAASRAGEMLVGLGNEWKPLREGLARTLAPEDPTATPRPIPPAAKVSLDHALIVVGSGEPGHAGAAWEKIKDAVSYDAVLTSVSDKALTPKHQIVTDPGAIWGSLHPGAYAVSVTGVDRYGLPGAAPEPSVLRVLGLELPESGSVAADGSISLGRDQRVGLTGAAGLEVSYGASSVFVPAPSTLGLSHGGSTVVRLRAAGQKEETLVRLEPRGLRANVAIGPKVARWPLDHVVVDIELYDANGKPVPEDAEALPTITVNLEKMDVKWTRTGRTLHAELQPGAAPGPWVVRAEVHDARGDLLGRDFLEVAPVVRNEAATASLSR